MVATPRGSGTGAAPVRPGGRAVLVLAPDPWEAGGIGRATRTLLEALTDLYGRGNVGVVPLWSRSPGEGLPAPTVRPAADRGGRRRVPLWERLRYVADTSRVVRRSPAPRTIIATHAHLAPVADLAGRLADARYVVWCHGREVWGDLPPWVGRSLRRADAAWSVSRFTAHRLRGRGLAPDGRVALLPHALSPELTLRSPQEPDGPPTVLSVGSLDRARDYKGIDTLLLAWPMVQVEMPRARLLVVGDGDGRRWLERLAARTGVGDHVTFAGRVSDERLVRAYAQAAVFALPARVRLGPAPAGEGFGLVYVEAAAAGLPVVAGRAGGAPEAVRDGETGLLVDPEDPAAVASAITRLLTDRSRASAMGRAGRRWVADHFSYQRFRETVADLLATLGHPVPDRGGSGHESTGSGDGGGPPG